MVASSRFSKLKQSIDEIYASIEEELRSQYSLGYTPDKADAEPGYHENPCDHDAERPGGPDSRVATTVAAALHNRDQLRKIKISRGKIGGAGGIRTHA